MRSQRESEKPVGLGGVGDEGEFCGSVGGGGIILAPNEQLYNFYQTQPQGLLSLAVSPLNTVMIKRLLKEEGWRRGRGVRRGGGGDGGGGGGGPGAVKRGHCGQEER